MPRDDEAVGVTCLKKVNNNCRNELLPIVGNEQTYNGKDNIISEDKHINLWWFTYWYTHRCERFRDNQQIQRTSPAWLQLI
jgi:hypothetical protein